MSSARWPSTLVCPHSVNRFNPLLCRILPNTGYRKMCQKRLDLGRALIAWVALGTEQDKPAHPIDAGVRSATAAIQSTDTGGLVKQLQILAAAPEVGSTSALGCSATFDMTGNLCLICLCQTFGTHEVQCRAPFGVSKHSWSAKK